VSQNSDLMQPVIQLHVKTALTLNRSQLWDYGETIPVIPVAKKNSQTRAI